MGRVKANRAVVWFWNSIVKKGDAKRIAAQQIPDFDDAVLDVRYADDDNPLHTLNIYKPKGATQKLPVILDIHGGGWYYGDKELNSYFCRSLVRHGFAVVDISYRLAPETDIFGQVKDVCLAADYIFDNAEKYGLDKRNMFIAGDSAGGHISALIANIINDESLKKKFGVNPSWTLRAAGLICPALEPLKLAPLPKCFMKFYFNPIFGKGYLKNGVDKTVSFESFLNKDICPCFFASSYGDFLKKQTRRGYELVKAQCIDSEYVYADKPLDKKHNLNHVYNVLNWDWRESEDVNKRMCDFFKNYLI